MLDQCLTVARQAGWDAAALLRQYAQGGKDLAIQEKQGAPVTAADLAVNHLLLTQLQAAFGTEDFGYLTEETYQPGVTPDPHPYLWVIDPLDGTRDFIQQTGEYAIHIALVQAGRPVMAVVVWPEAEKLYSATLGGGAFVETYRGERQRLQVSSNNSREQFRWVASRSHRDQRLNHVLDQFPRPPQIVGSVGCKVATLVEQRAEAYLSLPTQSAPKDWDLAAPELILTEAGGQFTHLDLTPLRYNGADVSQWGGVLASNGPCHQELCQEICTLLAAFAEAENSAENDLA